MICVRGLYAGYEGQVILENVTFSIGEGEIVGLIGPNGAGKTTTIRILSTLASATGGTAVVCGRDVNQDLRHRSADGA